MSSQVLPQPTSLLESHRIASTHLPRTDSSSVLAESSSSSLSSRPRRAAAQASRDAIQAAARPAKRRKSQSSVSTIKSSGSTTSSSTLNQPRTPQLPSSLDNDKVGTRPYDPASEQSSVATLSRPMAALPRAKRPRRNEPASAVQTLVYPSGMEATAQNAGHSMGNNGNLQTHYRPAATMNGVNTYSTHSNGAAGPSSKTSIVAGIDTALNAPLSRVVHGHADTNRLHASSVASSSMSRGSATANSIKEMIGGQEHDVILVDSASPHPEGSNYDTNGAGGGRTVLGVKGKRKAPGSPAPAGAGMPFEQAARAEPSAISSTKRRRKEPYPPTSQGLTQAQLMGATYEQQQALYAGQGDPNSLPTGAGLGNYRGGYPAGNAYFKQANELARHTARQHFGSPAYPPIPPPAQPVDDQDGHYIVREGAYVSEKYQIESLLGQGTFGKVVKCRETRNTGKVAVKIIRAVQKYTDAAQIEIRVLQALRKADSRNENKCIHLIETFTYLNHVCIVSELLGQSVFDFLKDNTFHPFPPRHIWSFAQQLLKSVAFLHKLNLVHTDLKPENILLVEDEWDSVPTSNRYNAKRRRVLRNTDIRLIDFGSATFNDEYHSQIVSTRHYRAPEIILQMGWSFPCDVWSIGCILVEFYTGDALFQTHENVEHLAMMEAVLGSMPDDFRRKAETCRPNFFRNGRLDFPNRTTVKQSREFVRKMHPLDNLTRKSAVAYQKHDARFIHLLKRLLHFDPTQRIKVEQALQHPYFELKEHEIPP